MTSSRSKEPSQAEIKLSGSKPKKMRKPESDPAFIARLEEITALAGGQNALARAANISLGAVQSYLAGSEPSRRIILQLCKSVGVRVEWLVSGEGVMLTEREASSSLPPAGPESMPASLDHDFGGVVSEAILNLYREENARLPTARILAIGFEKYEEIMSASTDPAERNVMLKLVLQQLRKDLRAGTKATTHGKRSA